ncbi:MAG: hypothetical protein KDD62_04370, partial [Bdellovibrionales bacterium]|nr:hypothetical protein [Bdellovibrionales bacterium]
MNDEGLIEESKALTATGVSAQTLKRFVETGYLSCETRDGTLCYNTSELQALFDLESACLNNLQSPATEVSQAELPAAEIESEVEIDPLSTSSPTDTILSTPSEPIETDASREKELQRLSILNEMYEKLLDRREQEIKDLHEQRAWL